MSRRIPPIYQPETPALLTGRLDYSFNQATDPGREPTLTIDIEGRCTVRVPTEAFVACLPYLLRDGAHWATIRPFNVVLDTRSGDGPAVVRVAGRLCPAHLTWHRR